MSVQVYGRIRWKSRRTGHVSCGPWIPYEEALAAAVVANAMYSDLVHIVEVK